MFIEKFWQETNANLTTMHGNTKKKCFLLKTDPYILYIRLECGHFFYQTEQVKCPKVRYDFRSPNPKFWCDVTQSIHFQKFQGTQILIFFVKIGLKLLFTLKNKRRKQIRNLSFKNYYLWPPKKHVFCFWRKNPYKSFFFMLWL